MTFRRLGARTAASVATLVLAAGAADHAAGVAQQAPANVISLTRSASLAAPRSAIRLDPWERRSRLVTPNAGALPNRAAAGSAPGASSQLSIDLFDGASVTAVFERFDANDNGVTWIGSVPGQPGSHVTVVQGSGLMAASIILPDASYTIRPVPIDPANPGPGTDGIHVLSQINSAGFAREAEPLVPEITAAALDVAADAVMADTAEFIDVLVVYTSLAENWAGGPAGIINWINLGMSETNTAYATSGVNQRVRLAHAQRVAYTEVGSFSTNLNNLRAGAPGLETVATLRNVYTADLVSMLVRPTEPATACGIAFIMTSVSTAFAPNGYSVVDSPCSSPNGTFAHELGHNMGLRHDWFMDNGVTPFTYAHGHVSILGGFRTVMAYPNACGGCVRLLRFSNPDLTFNGVPMGVPGGTSITCPTGAAFNMSCDADERRALNDSAIAVANFRQFSELRPPSIRAHPQNQSVPRGQAITLGVVAEGLGPLTYQWYRGAAPTTARPVAGATGPTYTFTLGDDGVWFERWFYWVQVSNAIGPVNSFTATITLLQPGAAADAPQRGIAVRDTARTPTPNARTVSTAQPRTRPGVPAAPAVPSVAQAVDDGQCVAAQIDALIALAVLSRRSGQDSTVTTALAELVEVLQNLFTYDADSTHCSTPPSPVNALNPRTSAPLKLGRIADELN